MTFGTDDYYQNIGMKGFIQRYGIVNAVKRGAFMFIKLHLVKDYEVRKVLWQERASTKIKPYLKYKDTDVEGLSFPENDVENPIWIYWNKGIEQAPIIVQKCYEFLTTRNGFFMGSFLVAVGKCLADYESKIRNIRILKLILPVAIIVLYVEGILVSKIDSECIINITFTTVIAAIVLVAFMISLPQIEANKNARNISTVIYLCHPWIIFAVGSLEHFEIACNGWVKVVISMIMSICTAFLVVKMSNKFKIIRKFI